MKTYNLIIVSLLELISGKNKVYCSSQGVCNNAQVHFGHHFVLNRRYQTRLVAFDFRAETVKFPRLG